YILFASPDLSDGSTYSLKSGSQTVATAAAGTASTGGMGMGGPMGGNPGMTGERPSGGFPGRDDGTAMDGQQPPELPADGSFPEAPQDGSGFRPPFGGGGKGTAPDGSQAPDGSGNLTESGDESLSADSTGSDADAAGSAQEAGWFQSILQAIANFFRSLFSKH
ncbi:MAG: hypothetical protein J6P31_02495, partial [Oscillospiraceae bacterium]|nr:hypothetical protein [Oscillospiraceae bacterium]